MDFLDIDDLDFADGTVLGLQRGCDTPGTACCTACWSRFTGMMAAARYTIHKKVPKSDRQDSSHRAYVIQWTQMITNILLADIKTYQNHCATTGPQWICSNDSPRVPRKKEKVGASYKWLWGEHSGLYRKAAKYSSELVGTSLQLTGLDWFALLFLGTFWWLSYYVFDFICTKVFAGHSHRSAPGKTMALLKLLSWNPV